MTRINASIPPEALCDQHLLAEHREIVRLRHLVSSKSPVTPTFRLGKGHVLYFKNKLEWALDRYKRLYAECVDRGFSVSFMGTGWVFPPQISRKKRENPHLTTTQKQQLIERILDRYPKNCRYKGKPLSKEEYHKKLLKFT